MPDLQYFPLFMKLPYDLRVQIWLLLMPRNQIVRVYEQIQYYFDECQYPEDDPQDDPDEDDNDRMNRFLDQECDYAGRDSKPQMPWHLTIKADERQKQLERFGFTSRHPPPLLLAQDQIDGEQWRWWDNNRVSSLKIEDACVPVLMHTCRESRYLLQKQGYAYAFSTRTEFPPTWFNFNHDYLYVDYRREREELSTSIDLGHWNVGQLIAKDRIRIKKLALSFEDVRYLYGEVVPMELHMAIQLCGHLEEVMLVESDGYPEWGGQVSSSNGVAIDIGIEELLGHCLNWTPSRATMNIDFYQRGFRDGYVKDPLDPLRDVCREMETQIRNHEPLLSPSDDGSRNTWTTPKIRFVAIVPRREADTFEQSRRYFRTDVEQWINNLSPGRRLNQTTRSDQARREYYRSRPPGWLKEAREMVYARNGWPSPYTLERRDAEAARDEMDDWSDIEHSQGL
jgi:hypothetical protein